MSQGLPKFAVMARRLRQDFEGALHFVTNRGTAQTAICRTDRDRRFFLWLLGELETRFGVQVIAYVLMGNHYHLILRSVDGRLADAMQFLDGTHARRFNQVHDRSGSLWQGRYDDRLITHEAHFERAGIYLHLNPQRAELVSRAVDYAWSSFGAYTAGRAALRWLHLDLLGGRSGAAYLADVMAELGAVQAIDDSEDEVHAWCSHRDAQLEHDFQESDRAVASTFGVSVDEIHVPVRGRTNVARMAAIARAAELGLAPVDAIARRYGLRSASGVRAARRRLIDLADRDHAVNTRLEWLGMTTRRAG